MIMFQMLRPKRNRHVLAGPPSVGAERRVYAIGDVHGRLDLLVEQEAGYIIVDHKSFPGVLENDVDRLMAVAGQLSAYAQALEIATGKPTLGFWMHQPIAGQAIRFERVLT